MQLELQRAELTPSGADQPPATEQTQHHLQAGAPALLAVTAQRSTQAYPCEMRMVTIIMKQITDEIAWT